LKPKHKVSKKRRQLENQNNEEELPKVKFPRKKHKIQPIQLLEGNQLLHKRVKVYWPIQGKWYQGTVTGYNSKKMLCKIEYDDGDITYEPVTNEIKILPDKPKLAKKRSMNGNVSKEIKRKKTDIVSDNKQKVIPDTNSTQMKETNASRFFDEVPIANGIVVPKELAPVCFVCGNEGPFLLCERCNERYHRSCISSLCDPSSNAWDCPQCSTNPL